MDLLCGYRLPPSVFSVPYLALVEVMLVEGGGALVVVEGVQAGITAIEG